MLKRAAWPARVAAAVLVGLAGTVPPRSLQGSQADGDVVSVDRRADGLVPPAPRAKPDHPSTDAGIASRAPHQTLSVSANALRTALPSAAQRYLDVLHGLPGASEAHVIHVGPAPLGAGTLRLELSPEHTFLAVHHPIDLGSTRSSTWYGNIVGGGYALFVQHGAFLHGVVETPQARYKFSPLGPELCAVQRVVPQTSDEPVCVAEEHRDAALTLPSAVERVGPRLVTSDDERRRVERDPFVVIDVLVAYEAAAAELVPDMLGHIDLLSAWANVSYVNSRIHTAAGPCWPGEQCVMPVLRIVATLSLACEHCANEQVTNLYLNNRFAERDDGWFDEVHDLRDATAADVCVMLTAYDRLVGSGSSKLGSPRPEWAFCLAETPYSILHPYIFAHEIGHLQGAGHFDSAGDRPYARGWCHNPAGGDPANRFSTIMCTQSPVRIQYWSNPELDHEPTPGNVFPIGDEQYNNARRLNETALVVASHRGNDVTPVTVSDFVGARDQTGTHLAWRLSSESLDELSGVHVQRATQSDGPYVTVTPSALEPRTEMTWTDAWSPASEALASEVLWYRLHLNAWDEAPSVVGPVRVDALHARVALEAPQVRDGVVVIRYSVGPHPTSARLAVYDVRGRLVRIVVLRERAVGSFEVAWDRRDGSGNAMARGVYWLQLTAGRETSIRKMLLLHD